MANKSLGTLTLDLVAKIGGYTAGLDKAEKEAKKRAAAIEGAFKDASKGIGVAIGAIGLAGGAAFAGFNEAIKMVGDFQDLAEQTGASAEGLASFALAAGTAGTSMEEIAGASVKLTKNLTGVDDESKAAGAAIASLGLNLEEFKQLAPEEQMETVAKQLATVGNAADRTAIAMDLFGKSGAKIIPFLTALNEQGGRTVILTAQMIKQADDYADAQAKAVTELKLYAGVLASQVLPSVTDFTKVMTDAIKETLGLSNGVSDLKNNDGVQKFAEGAVDSIAFVADAAQGLKTVFSRVGEFIGATGAIMVEKITGTAAGVEAIRKAYNESLDTSQFKSIQDSLKAARAERKKMEQLAAQENRGFTPGSGRTYDGKTGKGGGGKKEKDPTAEAKRYIEQLQKQLEKTQELTVAEQALQDIAMGRLGLVTKEQKETILNTAAQVDALKAQKKQEEQTKKYKEALEDVNVKLAEMRGLTSEAAAIRFDKENSALYTLFSEQGDEEAKKKLDTLKKMTVAAAQFAEQQEKSAKVQNELSRKEERISRDMELGISGQMEGLAKLGEARKSALNGMKQSLTELQAIQASGVELTAKQKDTIAELTNEIEDLSTRLDPLGEKFNGLISDAAGNAFTDFIEGTKSAKDAFKDFTNSVMKEITSMVAKDLAKKLFSSVLGVGSGSGGGAGGIGGWLSQLFGSSTVGGFERGGFTGYGAANEPAGIVHKGEYVLDAETTRRIGVSNLQSGNLGSGQVNNFYLEGQVDRRTQSQIAQKTRQTQLTAAARFR